MFPLVPAILQPIIKLSTDAPLEPTLSQPTDASFTDKTQYIDMFDSATDPSGRGTTGGVEGLSFSALRRTIFFRARVARIKI